jgi:hypothetical protein
MVLYARTPARFLRQILGDVLVVAWLVVWLLVASKVHEQVARLAEPGRQLESAGEGFSAKVSDAANTVDGLPVVGDSLRTAFDGVRSAGTAIADAGRTQQAAVEDLALLLALIVGVLPIVLALMWWLPRRITWIRRASAATRLLDHGGLELFALRALTSQPVGRLQRLGPDLLSRWQERDPATVARLAALEMSSLGLRPPRPVRPAAQQRERRSGGR